MNVKTILGCIVVYAAVAAFITTLHLLLSRNGMGNEFMLFGFPLYPLFLAALASTSNDLSRSVLAVIVFGCFVVSTISIPIHYLAPERLANPYCGPVGVLLTLPMLSILYLVYNRFIKPRQALKNKQDAR